MQHTPAVESPPEPLIDSGGATRRELAAVLVLVFVASALWAISSPLMSTPDEPAHVTKAAGVWQGWWRGERVEYPPTDGDPSGAIAYRVRAPESYASANAIFMCFALQPTVTPDCAPELASGDSLVPVETAAGSYPPLYYAVIGWPSRIVDADVGLYLMRLVSAAWCAASFAIGYWALRKMISPALASVAVLVAATPEVLFLAGSVNPNAVEIAAGFALWCTVVALLRNWEVDAPVDRALVAATLVSTLVFAHNRTLSPAFAVGIVAVAGAFVGRARLAPLVRDRRAWATAGSVGVAIVSAVPWILATNHLQGVTTGVSQENVFVGLVAATDDWFSQMIAVFGWLDVGPVLVAVWVWLALIVLVVALGAGTGRAWQAAVLMGLVVAVVAVPVVLQYPAARSGNVIWQGRYFLPVAVGVPILAVVACDPSHVSRRLGVRVWTFIAAAAAVGALASHMAAMRRYVVGVDGPLDYFGGSGWRPPVPSWFLAAATFALGTMVTLLVRRLAATAFGDPTPTAAATSETPPVDEPPPPTGSGEPDAIDMTPSSTPMTSEFA